MKQYLYILLATFLFSNVQAQNIKGTIKSQTGEAIAFANILVLNSSNGTVADKNGNFSLDLNKGKHELQFSAVGFAAKVKQIEVTNQSLTIDVTLSDNSRTLGEVIVTANKREEDIVKVPTSITSISAKKIEDTRTWGLGGLTALVPNYNYQELGIPSQQVQSIRGIQVFSENPAVATYIDDVNNLDILANGFALTDIERIEVLRGPQGTLFGRNAMGGVVNIITKKPSNKQEGFADFSAGNLGLVRSSFGYRTPIVNDKLFCGVNALYQTQNGYWKNDTTGTVAPDRNANGKTVGGENNLYGNLFLKWLPSKRFNVTLNLKGQRDWSDNSAFMVSQQKNAEQALQDPDVINLSRIAQHERKILNNSLVAKYFADKFAITSITAYQTISFAFKDLDFPGIYHSFVDKEIGENLPPQKVFSQELRINSTASSKIQYTAGLFAFTQKGYEPTTNTAYELSSTNYVISRNISKNAGFAAFGELSYQITDKLKATGGLRYDYEKREATFNGFFDAFFTNGVVTNVIPDTTAKGNYTALSPKLALSYAVGNNANLYVTYTRGFRTGGVNTQRYPANSGIRQTFDPEYSNNYELGYKTFLANKKVSIAASAFLIQWKDLQLFNLAAPFTYARENLGDAQSSGFELEVSAIAAKGLQVDGSFGLNKTEYKDFILKRPGNETQIGGKKLSNAPSHTFFLGMQYETAVSKKVKAVIRGEVRNIGSYYTDIQNSIKQPTYTVINSRAGITTDKYSLFVWVQNLGNERFLAFGTPDTSFGNSVRTAAPRTFGITLSTKF